MNIDYSKLKWPEVPDLVNNESVAIVPFGATEEHGTHLPLDVDTNIITSISKEAAKQTQKDIVLPPITYGFQSHHMGFPGTINIPSDVLIKFGRSVVGSLALHGFKHILLTNGHGSNRPIIDLIARHTIVDYPETLCASISWWELTQVREAAKGIISNEPTSHGCDLETSVYLYLNHEYVDMNQATSDGLDSRTPHFWSDLLGRRPKDFSNPASMMEIWDTMTESGVRGNAILADAKKGEKIFNAATKELAEILDEFRLKKPRPHKGPYKENKRLKDF